MKRSDGTGPEGETRPSETAALNVKSLYSGYGSTEVVANLDLAVAPGEVVAILGKNGMGKSTLLKTIAGLLTPSSGSIRLFGDEIGGREAFKIARLGLSYIAQDRALFPDLTVRENLALALRNRAEIDEVLDRAAEWFPVLGRRRGQVAGTLSGGEQKMLLVARALIVRPRLLLLDEITEGLQPSVRDDIRVALENEVARQGLSVVLVEQDVQFAFGLAHRFAAMRLGTIVEGGATASSEWRTVAESHLSV